MHLPHYPRKNSVRPERLELSRHKALEPKSSASANSATGASLMNSTQWCAANVNWNLSIYSDIYIWNLSIYSDIYKVRFKLWRSNFRLAFSGCRVD